MNAIVIGAQPRPVPDGMQFVSVLTVVPLSTPPPQPPPPLQSWGAICFASPHAVHVVCKSAAWASALKSPRIYAIGERSFALLQTYGFNPRRRADSWEALEATLTSTQPILFPRVQGEPDPVSRVQLHCVGVYRTVPITPLEPVDPSVRVVCALSPKATVAFMDACPSTGDDVRWVAIGPTTAAACRRLGRKRVFVASEPNLASVLEIAQRLVNPGVAVIGGGGTLGCALKEHWAHAPPLRTSTSGKPGCALYASPDPRTLRRLASEAKVLVGAVAPIQSKFRSIGLTDCDAFYDVVRSTYMDTARDLVQTAQATGAHLVWISSHNVYPNADGALVDEDTPCLPPRHRTAAILLSAERLVLQDYPNTTVLRMGWLVGTARPWSATMRKMQHVTIRGGQEQAQMNTTALADACRIIEHVVAHRLLGVFDCARSQGCSWRVHWAPICAEHGLSEPTYDPSTEDFWFEGDHRIQSTKLLRSGFEFGDVAALTKSNV